MKKRPISNLEVRKICNLDPKRDAWMIRIPKKILDELKLRGKFVTLEISDMCLIITEVTPAIEKRISEKTTAQTIQKEIIQDDEAKINPAKPKKGAKQDTHTKVSDEKQEDPVEESDIDYIDNTEEIKKQLFGEDDGTEETKSEESIDENDNKNEIIGEISEDIMSQLEQ